MGYIQYAKSLSSASDDVDRAFLDIVDGPGALTLRAGERQRERGAGQKCQARDLPSRALLIARKKQRGWRMRNLEEGPLHNPSLAP